MKVHIQRTYHTQRSYTSTQLHSNATTQNMDDIEDDVALSGGVGAGAGASTSTSASSSHRYLYSQEIGQMMFVFGHVVDPSKEVLQLVEDIVRHQVVQMIIQARQMSLLRQGRALHPEDLIFLVRYDRAKVNRLRTYLSWKDIRKNAKDESSNPAAAGPGEIDIAVDEGTASGPGAAPPAMSRKLKVKLPWEYSTIFSDYTISTEDEELDEDDQEALMESRQRLREADKATLRMTREQYEHYSECRAASFTFKKGKKFREFISSSTYLDNKPNDDIVDILGFLAFEVVRELTIGAREAWIKEYVIVIGREEERERRCKERERRAKVVVEESESVESVVEVQQQPPVKTGKRKRDSPSPASTPPPASYLDPHKAYTSSINVSDDEPLADGQAFCGLFSISDDHKKRDEELERREKVERLLVREKAERARAAKRESERRSRERESVGVDKKDEGKEGAANGKQEEGKEKSIEAEGKGKSDEAEGKEKPTSEVEKESSSVAEVKASGGESGSDATKDTEMVDEPAKSSEVEKAESEAKDANADASAESTESKDSHVDAASAPAPDATSDKAATGDADDAAKATAAETADNSATQTTEDPTTSEANTGYKEITPLLQAHHIREAFARLQREKTRPALSSGSRDVGVGMLSTGGLRRTRMWVI